MHHITTVCILAIAISAPRVESARILCVFPFPAFSHQLVYRPIWKELSRRGHEVTVITTHPLGDPTLKNVREIDVSFLERLMMDTHDFNRIISTEPFHRIFQQFFAVADNVSEEFFKCERVRDVVEGKESYDLIVGEMVFPSWYALSEKFRCPLILMNSMPISLTGHDCVGNPSHSISHPDFNLPFGPKLGFLERVTSVAFSVYFRYVMGFYHFPRQLDIARRYVGEGVKDLYEIQKRADVVFTHVIEGFHPPRPIVPAYIELSGLHIQPEGKLPEYIEAFMDSAGEGVVYVSFGSAVKGRLLPQNLLNVLIKTFSKLPLKVLWKYEEDLVHIPGNVLVKPWYPQQDILRHPNMRLFITHGGLQSISEAIFSSVPLIGIPFFGDQFYNTLRFEPLGMGLSLDKDNLDEDMFRDAIAEVIGNPKYRLKMKALADLATDQPVKPLDKAVWWVEYVIRHKGAKHLRSPAVDMPLYQYFLLDVLLCFALFFVITFLMCKQVIRVSLCFLKAFFKLRNKNFKGKQE